MAARSLVRRLVALEAAQRATAATRPRITVVAVNLTTEDGETRHEYMTPAATPIDYRAFVACLAPPGDTHHAT